MRGEGDRLKVCVCDHVHVNSSKFPPFSCQSSCSRAKEVEGAHGDSPALEPDEIELGPEQVETGHGDSPALEHARDPEDEVSAALGGDSGDEVPAGMSQFGYAFKIFCILSCLQQNSYKN